MKIPLHYDPELREQHSINVVDLETCEFDHEPYPCTVIQLLDSIDVMNEQGLGHNDVATGVWISGPHKGRP
jgi:hypothetical protein